MADSTLEIQLTHPEAEESTRPDIEPMAELRADKPCVLALSAFAADVSATVYFFQDAMAALIASTSSWVWATADIACSSRILRAASSAPTTRAFIVI